MQKKAFRGENRGRTSVRASKDSLGVPSFPFTWKTRSNDWYWFGTDGIKFKKIRKIYGEESVHNRKNKFDFDTSHQSRTYFLFEKELLSRSQIIEPLKKWLNDRQQRSFDRFFFSSYFFVFMKKKLNLLKKEITTLLAYGD